MNILINNLMEPIYFMKLLCMAFLAILFLQSGLDKVFNYKGNHDWLKSHFEKSPLKNMVGLMFPLITLLEVGAGLLSVIGLILFLIDGSTGIGLIGAQLSGLSILALFFGQRLTKDYAGAAVLAGYFLVCLASIYVLGI